MCANCSIKHTTSSPDILAPMHSQSEWSASWRNARSHVKMFTELCSICNLHLLTQTYLQQLKWWRSIDQSAPPYLATTHMTHCRDMQKLSDNYRKGETKWNMLLTNLLVQTFHLLCYAEGQNSRSPKYNLFFRWSNQVTTRAKVIWSSDA